ncbi:MAG: type I DNA topoisomerase [Dethiobacteria bacterium]|jgi:DNA topoisomerase-1|nr:type I DNA topoisomerase [Bacillota bacterium]NMD33173.1 type I DNA topoisomerase [Bacillota bacterium]HOB29185.1 type I DNA topoisomerase [Bacillota bacterium]HPZ41797.1 type I DNA topoisomerase [Bacillota bacterium]HQD52666.1 type I DNA topoisomerase [Bacillota bacterium]
MSGSLVIVESPTKARTLRKFLGSNYRVLASQGHLIDLPKSKLGIDLENDFAPRYITIRGKGKVLQKLKEAGKKAEKVYLAADPDREGEAICWHLSQALKIDPDLPCRVEFNEITENAVKEAFKHPRSIDMNRVDAQQARRILDRLVGYQISPLLWRNVRSGLSAGRVQSVALRLICERQKEIEEFIEEEYWTLEALLQADGTDSSFKASLERHRGEKVALADQQAASKVIEDLTGALFTVKQIKKSRRRRRPAPPFITSSLQQEAASKLGFTGRKTMALAQQLYEGINLGDGQTSGLITYIRTDSTRVAAQAQHEARELIANRFGEDYLPARPPQYRSRKSAQEAHEAIRPTAVHNTPQALQPYLSRDQARLYKLIWERFVASQMAPAVYDQVRVDIAAGEYEFKASGSSLAFPGFLKVYPAAEKEEETVLPPLKEGQQLNLVEFLPRQHFTQPPPRYNDASLIKTLEEKGIGRPSTYVPIIETIINRGYVVREKKAFTPTELGFIVVDLMKQHFPEVIDVDFTARLEEQLDQVEEGKLERNVVLHDFYQTFQEQLRAAEREMKKVELKVEVSEETCPRCGKNLVYKHGRFGRFLACPGYPECKYTKNIVKQTGVPCPLDGGMLVERRSRKGRIFYGCSNYPQCRFSVWDKPVPGKCPRCGSLMVQPNQRSKKGICCSNKECGYKASSSPEAVEDPVSRSTGGARLNS